MEFLKIFSRKWIRVQTNGNIVQYSWLRGINAILRISRYIQVVTETRAKFVLFYSWPA